MGMRYLRELILWVGLEIVWRSAPSNAKLPPRRGVKTGFELQTHIDFDPPLWRGSKALFTMPIERNKDVWPRPVKKLGLGSIRCSPRGFERPVVAPSLWHGARESLAGHGAGGAAPCATPRLRHGVEHPC
jgi:hypothetical protein